MQLSNAPGKLVLPFANAGAKNTIPAASQIGITAGAASLTDGFPPLTRTPIAAGGVPPSGLDMNGILYALSAALRWANAGGGYVYDSTFAADPNVDGYPKGARVLRSDGTGYWLNTIDGNTVNPESVTVNQAQIAGWVPDLTNGVATVTMTSANVTLTPLQYGKPIIVLSGTLTANLNLIFPNLAGEWTVVNNCTGAFTVTAKTAAGTGAVVTPGSTRIIWSDGTNIAGAMNEVETPPQFDNKTKIATTAFVKNAGMQASNFILLAGNTALTPAHAGATVATSYASAQTWTLPLANAVPAGSRIEFACFGTGLVTIQRAGSNVIMSQSAAGSSFISIGNGDVLTLESDGNTGWYVVVASILAKVCGVYGDGTLNLPASSYTKVTYNSVEFDSPGFWDTTNQRFSAKFPGKYRISGAGLFISAVTGGAIFHEVRKNGVTTDDKRGDEMLGQGSNATLTFNAVFNLAVGDYLEVLARNGATVAQTYSSSSNTRYANFEYLGQ